jgi:predicted RNA-binding Zn ribbon-like protein
MRPERPELQALVGGWSCLDFANTVGPRRPDPGEEQHDYIPGYEELVAWAAHAGLVNTAQQAQLTAAAEAGPDAAAAVHERARRLREAIYEAFAAVAQSRPAPPGALATIKDAYVAALRNAYLGVAPSGQGWRWPDDGRPEQVLWPVAASAVDLAVSGRVTRIRQCPGDGGQCGWLFVDTSKNATRRWCSMRTCGSKVKSRRQAARRRTTRAG